MGGAEYAKIGTETSTGTKVVSISGQRQAPGQLRDRARHARRASILFDLAGGPLDGPHVQGVVPRRLELARCCR